MTYALDSNIISFLLRPSRNQEVVGRFKNIIAQGHRYTMPPLCHYEVYWYLVRKEATAQIRVFEALYAESLINDGMRQAEFIKAAEIRVHLEKHGVSIGNKDADILIASHCIINGYILVTDNTKDFERIDGIVLENWKE